MYWRSLSFYRDVCSVLLALGLTILLTSQLPSPLTSGEEKDITAVHSESSKVDELSITSSDLALSYPCAKNENVDLTFCFSLHSDRLIRSSVFDENQIEILTEKLAWFTSPAYYTTLATLWRPSILIAQGKLTI